MLSLRSRGYFFYHFIKTLINKVDKHFVKIKVQISYDLLVTPKLKQYLYHLLHSSSTPLRFLAFAELPVTGSPD